MCQRKKRVYWAYSGCPMAVKMANVGQERTKHWTNQVRAMSARRTRSSFQLRKLMELKTKEMAMQATISVMTKVAP